VSELFGHRRLCTVKGRPDGQTSPLKFLHKKILHAGIPVNKKGDAAEKGDQQSTHLLAPKVTAASEQEWELARQLQEVTGESVKLADVDQGLYWRSRSAGHPAGSVVKLLEAKKGFALLPRRWVVARSFGWAARFRRLSRDDERLASTLAGLHGHGFRHASARLALPKVNNRL
jgi:hypothetical protein